MLHSSETKARPGDRVVVHGHAVEDHGRTGIIVEVLAEGEHEHYRVRWEDEHESLFWPGVDASIEHANPAA